MLLGSACSMSALVIVVIAMLDSSFVMGELVAVTVRVSCPSGCSTFEMPEFLRAAVSYQL